MLPFFLRVYFNQYHECLAISFCSFEILLPDYCHNSIAGLSFLIPKRKNIQFIFSRETDKGHFVCFTCSVSFHQRLSIYFIECSATRKRRYADLSFANNSMGKSV
jgi:hypothetical protein